MRVRHFSLFLRLIDVLPDRLRPSIINGIALACIGLWLGLGNTFAAPTGERLAPRASEFGAQNGEPGPQGRALPQPPAGAIRRGGPGSVLASLRNVVVSGINSRGGHGDIAAAYFMALDLLRRPEFAGQVFLLAGQPQRRVLERLFEVSGPLPSRLRIVTVPEARRALEGDAQIDLYLRPAAASADEPPPASLASRIRRRVTFPVYGNTEARSEQPENALVQTERGTYEVSPPGFQDSTSGIYRDPVAAALAGRTHAERLAYLEDALEQVANPTTRAAIHDSILAAERGVAYWGLVYGVSSKIVRRQFNTYLRTVLAEHPDRPITLVTPSSVSLEQLEPDLQREVRIARTHDPRATQRLQVIVTETLPHQVFVALMSVSQLRPIIAGDAALSAAVELRIPFLMSEVPWNRQIIQDIGLRLSPREGAPPLLPHINNWTQQDLLNSDTFARLRESTPNLLDSLLANLDQIDRFERSPTAAFEPNEVTDRALRFSLYLHASARGDATLTQQLRESLISSMDLMRHLLMNRFPQPLFRTLGIQDDLFNQIFGMIESMSLSDRIEEAYVRAWARVARIEPHHLASLRSLAGRMGQTLGMGNTLTDYYGILLEHYEGDLEGELRTLLRHLLAERRGSLRRLLQLRSLQELLRPALRNRLLTGPAPFQPSPPRVPAVIRELESIIGGLEVPGDAGEAAAVRHFLLTSAVIALPTDSAAGFEAKLHWLRSALVDRSSTDYFEATFALIRSLFELPQNAEQIRQSVRFLRRLPEMQVEHATVSARFHLRVLFGAPEFGDVVSERANMRALTSLAFLMEPLAPTSGANPSLQEHGDYTRFRDRLLTEIRVLVGDPKYGRRLFTLFERYLFTLRQTGDRELAARLHEDVVFRQFRPTNIPQPILPQCSPDASGASSILRRILTNLRGQP